ncbi:MAG: hypothetical protein E7I48_16275 [Clostridium celatum]|nr:hypothetical protein [Clostridium celatum]
MTKIIKLNDYRKKKQDIPEDIIEIVHDLLRWDLNNYIQKSKKE